MFDMRTMALLAAANLFTATSVFAATTSYHVGNSLTWDSQPPSLSAFAALRGREHSAGYHILTGTPLNVIVAQPDDPNVSFGETYGRFDPALSVYAWTAVTMQPHTGSGSTMGTDVASMLELIDLTRSNPAHASTKFYVYAAWPARLNSYQSQWTAPVVDSLSTPTVRAREYYDHLIKRVRAATDAEVYMIPVGEVLSEIDLLIQQQQLPGFTTISQFYRDGLHMNVAYGRYLAAATTFATLLGEEPRGLTRPDGWFEWPSPLPENLFSTINETIRRVLNASPYSGVEFLDPPLADFDGSGVVDEVDLAMWQGAAGKTSVGDVNGDQIVDGSDFLAWQRRVGFDNRRTENFAPEDVNVDGVVDAGDLEFWRGAFAAGDGYDLDADGDSDGADFLHWQRAVTPTLPEDFDLSGVVSGGDLTLWQDNFGFNLAADANGDGYVDGTDFLIWQSEQGRVWPLPEAEFAVVPEPATWLLVLAGAVGLSRRRRRG
jgi:hypothetical protein